MLDDAQWDGLDKKYLRFKSKPLLNLELLAAIFENKVGNENKHDLLHNIIFFL